MINYSFSVQNLEFFLLIVVRISAFVFIAPFFSQKGIPNQVKIGFSIFFAALLYGVIPDKTIPEYSTIWGYAILVLREAMVGLLLGFSAVVCTSVVLFAGRIIDMETGLSMANLVDPTTNTSESITGVIFQYIITLMLIISGMYEYIIRAIAEAYELVPVGKAVFDSEKLLSSILVFLSEYMSIGFRICLPVFAVMLLLNAILGIMTKVAPQVNMFAVGMQMKVLVGIITLFLMVGMLPAISDMVFTEVRRMMATFVQTMM